MTGQPSTHIASVNVFEGELTDCEPYIWKLAVNSPTPLAIIGLPLWICNHHPISLILPTGPNSSAKADGSELE